MAVVFGRVKGMSVMKAFASNAERLGFSTLWAPEHIVLVDQYQSRYCGPQKLQDSHAARSKRVYSW
jgi:hypothetical protein